MKKLSRVLSLIIVLALVISVLPTSALAASKPSLSKTSVFTVVNGYTTISLKNATSSAVTWTSSNKNVATVSHGRITGVKAGTCKIKAKYKGRTYTCSVTVKSIKKGFYVGGSSNCLRLAIKSVKGKNVTIGVCYSGVRSDSTMMDATGTLKGNTLTASVRNWYSGTGTVTIKFHNGYISYKGVGSPLFCTGKWVTMRWKNSNADENQVY